MARRKTTKKKRGRKVVKRCTVTQAKAKGWVYVPSHCRDPRGSKLGRGKPRKSKTAAMNKIKAEVRKQNRNKKNKAIGRL